MAKNNTQIIEVEYPNLGNCTIEVVKVDSYTVETKCTFNHRQTKGEGANVIDAIDHACIRMLSILSMPENLRQRFHHLYEVV